MALLIHYRADETYVSSIDPERMVEKEADFPEAYIFISSVSGKDKLRLRVKTFTDSSKETELSYKEYFFTANMDGPNFIRQGYEYLKTLPEFAGAADC